jgi:hypothetical protein
MLEIDIRLGYSTYCTHYRHFFNLPTYFSPSRCFRIPIAIDSEQSSFMVTHLDRKDVAALGPQVV